MERKANKRSHRAFVALAAAATAQAIVSSARAQMIYEPFNNGAVGTALGNQQNPMTGTVWVSSGTGTDPSIASGSISPPAGLSQPTAGNQLQLTNSIGSSGQSRVDRIDVPYQSSGDLYYSCDLKVSDLTAVSYQTTGSFLAGFNQSQAINDVVNFAGARLQYRRDPNDTTRYQVGIRNDVNAAIGTAPQAWESANHAVGDTVFVVARYHFNPSTLTDDVASLWINPSAADYGAATAPSTSLTSTGGDLVGTETASVIQSFFFRENGITARSLTIDDLRVDRTWAQVTAPTGTTWANGSGTWSDSSNWSPGSVPNTAGAFVNVTGAAKTITVDGTKTIGTLNLNGVSGIVTKTDSAGALTFDGGAGGAGAINAYKGAYEILTPTALTSNTQVSVAAAAGVSISGDISGSGSLIKAGGGTLTLSGNNSYGKTTILDGTLSIAGDNNLGTATADPAAITLVGAKLLTIASFQLNAARGITVVGDAAGLIDTAINTTLTYAGVISGGTATGGFTKTGSGTMIVSGHSTYAGYTNVVGGPTGTVLRLAADDALPTNTYLALNARTSNGTATFDMGSPADTGFNQMIGGIQDNLSGVGHPVITNSGTAIKILTIANPTFNVADFSITGNVAIAKTNVGVLTLSGNNNYAGGTTVSSGTLLVSNTAGSGTGSGAVLVNGGTLGGSGTIAGPVTIASAAHIAPGGTAGTLTAGAGVTLAGGAILDYDLGSVNTGTNVNDLLAITGNLALGATATFNVNAYQGNVSEATYKLMTYSGTLTGNTSGWTLGSVNANVPHSYSFSSSTLGEIDLVVGPPPAGIWLGGMGNWNDSSKWTQGTVPNSLALHVKIDFGNPAASVTTLDTTDSVGDVSLDPPDTLNVSATGNLTIAGPAVSTVAGTLSNAGAITVSGGTTHIAKGIDGTGSITVSASAALTAAHIRQSALTVSGSAQLDAGGGIAGTSKVSSLTVGGRLDLTDNKLIVASGTVGSWNGVNYDGVAGLIKAGRNFGSWDGSGIITSMTAAGAPNSVASLAVAAAGEVGYGGTRTFGGQSVVAGDVLVMYTYTGDANLSGKIDADDYFQIDSHYNKSADSAKSWLNGDFNYDGKINGDDYFLIDNAYAGQGAPLSTGPQAISVSAVPEPVGFVLLGAMSLVTRRKRR